MKRSLVLMTAWIGLSCGGEPIGAPIQLTVPQGASVREVADTLAARGVIERAPLFRTFVRLRRADRSIKAGTYQFRSGEGWSGIIDALSRGRVVTVPMTIPEGWTLALMAPRLADATGLPEDTVRARLRADSLAERWQVPGPGLEGYLFPDTYRFTPGTALTARRLAPLRGSLHPCSRSTIAPSDSVPHTTIAYHSPTHPVTAHTAGALDVPSHTITHTHTHTHTHSDTQ